MNKLSKVESTVADRVSEVIEKSNISVKKLADRVGVSRPTIYRWANKGTETFDPDKLRNLARETNASYEWLQYGKAPSKDANLDRLLSLLADESLPRKEMIERIEKLESDTRTLLEQLQRIKNDLKGFEVLRDILSDREK